MIDKIKQEVGNPLFDHIVKGALLAGVMFLSSQVWNLSKGQAVLTAQYEDLETRELEHIDTRITTTQSTVNRDLADLRARVRILEDRLNRAGITTLP